jgi:calcium-dependent protein kinase
MLKIFSAIHYLHKRDICHRDIKPENFMFLDKSSESEIKVIDFGLSRKFEPNATKTLDSVVGTPLYVAPEVLKQKYDYRCDNWSLGVLMYVLLSGMAPFMGHNRKSVFKKIAKVSYNFYGHEWDLVSNEAKDLIAKLLVKDVDKRLTLE